MYKKNHFELRRLASLFVCCVLSPCSLTHAENALPTIGGGQTTMPMGAPMVHAGLSFDGQDLHVHLDTSVATPLLRSLPEPHQFDATEPWGVLAETAHNFQYGWVAEGVWSPPAGTAVWVEHLGGSPELRVYEGGRFRSEDTIRAMTFQPLFGTADSGPLWQWGGMMTHNAYAVERPLRDVYEANYRVFIGDAASGIEPRDANGQLRYGSDTVTFRFAATPVPEPAGAGLAMLALAGVARLRRGRSATEQQGA